MKRALIQNKHEFKTLYMTPHFESLCCGVLIKRNS